MHLYLHQNIAPPSPPSLSFFFCIYNSSMLINNKEIPIKELDIKWTPNALGSLKKEIESTNLLAIGEVHGVKDNADFYYTMAKEFKFDVLALEYPTDLREPLEKFLNDGTFPNHYTLKELDDGRVSYEMLACLKILYDEKIIKSIICFDGQINMDHWNERDIDYANQFTEQYNPNFRTLIIAGGYHVKTESFTADFEKGDLYGMAYHLKQKLEDFPVCNINYVGGQFYNYGVKEFAEGKASESMDNFSFSMLEPLKYKFLIKDAKHITIY
jgi:hypothetical protein